MAMIGCVASFIAVGLAGPRHHPLAQAAGAEEDRQRDQERYGELRQEELPNWRKLIQVSQSLPGRARTAMP